MFSGELSPYIQLEDAPDVAATSIMPKLYFFPWISKPMMEHDSQLPNENFGDSTFQFVIAFNLLPLVSSIRLMNLLTLFQTYRVSSLDFSFA